MNETRKWAITPAILPDGNRLSVSDPYELRRELELISGSCRSMFRGGFVLKTIINDSDEKMRASLIDLRSKDGWINGTLLAGMITFTFTIHTQVIRTRRRRRLIDWKTERDTILVLSDMNLRLFLREWGDVTDAVWFTLLVTGLNSVESDEETDVDRILSMLDGIGRARRREHQRSSLNKSHRWTEHRVTLLLISSEQETRWRTSEELVSCEQCTEKAHLYLTVDVVERNRVSWRALPVFQYANRTVHYH